MISLLSRLFIKDRENVSDPAVRRAYGTLCGGVGIFLNIVLFAIKYFAGTLSGSIAVTADAFNNLSDAGSSAITLAGFRLAGKKPDPGHPFGHGRIEYISGLAVAVIIMIIGFELGKSSVEKIIRPEAVEFSLLSLIILVISCCVKLYMCLYNRAVGKKISSPAMSATAMDSLTDSIATFVVLLSMLISRFFHINIDAYAGVLVAGFILYAGINAARDTLSPLLGQAPEKEFVEEIERIAVSHEEVIGIHDLIVHDYGPGRQMISLHAEVDGSGDIYLLHDAIDNVERELKEQLGCMATVHMDPVDVGNPLLEGYRQQVIDIVHEMDSSITIHDFRMVPGVTHTNLIFDAVLSFANPLTDAEAAEKICSAVHARIPGCYAVVNIDRAYA